MADKKDLFDADQGKKRGCLGKLLALYFWPLKANWGGKLGFFLGIVLAFFIFVIFFFDPDGKVPIGFVISKFIFLPLLVSVIFALIIGFFKMIFKKDKRA